MKKSYGYVSRNRVAKEAAQGHAAFTRQLINASKHGQPGAASMIRADSQSAQSADDIDRQLMRFFKEHE